MESEFKQLNMTASLKEAEAAAPPWIELPLDVTANILQRLGAVEILESAQKVCATWWRVCQNPDMWRVIKIIVNPNDHTAEEFTAMCRRAVDRSQGQLIDLTIANFGDHNLLDYIVDRSRQLRSLTLACCCNITSTGVSEAVKKLPELEELHLHLIEIDDTRDIKTIGICCPMLKSFTCTFDRRRRWVQMHGNERALAIANNMPNLHTLGLLGNVFINEGLQAILDGCPHLESLDLRQCLGLYLGGALGVRCREQIKDLRLPSDSIDDYEWDAAGEVDSYGDFCAYLNYMSEYVREYYDYGIGDDEEYY